MAPSADRPLIAIGLEQTVEFFHHRREVSETRAALHEEMQNNIVLFHQNVEGHIMTMAYLHNDLRIFEYLRDHPGTSQDRPPGILYWPIFAKPLQKAAWSTAERTDVLSLMPRTEVRESADSYAKLDYAWEAYQPVIASLTQCTTYFSQTPDISTNSSASVAAEIEIIKQTIAREARLRRYVVPGGAAARLRPRSHLVANAALLDHAGLLSMGPTAS